MLPYFVEIVPYVFHPLCSMRLTERRGKTSLSTRNAEKRNNLFTQLKTISIKVWCKSVFIKKLITTQARQLK